MGKKHHFVPRFYLKRFASDLDKGKSIRLYNFKSSQYVLSAKLYNQCYRPHFYGITDELENALSEFEGRSATVLKEIDKTGKLPERQSNDFVYLLLFLGMQLLRTGRAADDLDDQIDKISKTLISEYIERNNMDEMMPYLESMRIGLKDPVLLSISYYKKVALCLSDLKMHILETKSELEFITSDHPIQLYNSYCEGGDDLGITGILSTGLLLFFPISPSRCLLLYDSMVYKVGKPSIFKTTVNSFQDVFSINSMQFVGAEENIYCSSDLELAYFERLKSNYNKARLVPHTIVKGYQSKDDPMSSFIMNFHPMPKLNISLSFLSIRRNARKLSMQKRVNSYRMSIIPPDPLDPEETWAKSIINGLQVENNLAKKVSSLGRLRLKSVR